MAEARRKRRHSFSWTGISSPLCRHGMPLKLSNGILQSEAPIRTKKKKSQLHILIDFLLAPPTASVASCRPTSNNPVPEVVASPISVGCQDSSHHDAYGGGAALVWSYGPSSQSEGEKASCRFASLWGHSPFGSD